MSFEAVKININHKFESEPVSSFRQTFNSEIQRLSEIITNLSDEFQRLKNTQWTTFDPNFDLADAVKNFEIKLIKMALEVSLGNQTSAIKLLGIKKSTLNAKIKRYNICLKYPNLS